MSLDVPTFLHSVAPLLCQADGLEGKGGRDGGRIAIENYTTANSGNDRMNECLCVLLLTNTAGVILQCR